RSAVASACADGWTFLRAVVVARGARRGCAGTAVDALSPPSRRRFARIAIGDRTDAGDVVVAAGVLRTVACGAHHSQRQKCANRTARFIYLIVHDERSKSKCARPCTYFSPTARSVRHKKEHHLCRGPRLG